MPQATVNALIVDSAGNAYGGAVVGTAVMATSGNVAAAAAVAAMPAVSAKTNYVTGIHFSGSGATGASVVVATLAGLLGGTWTFVIAVPAGVTTGITPMTFAFDTPMPASTTNTAITLTVPSLGAGNTNSVANIRGYVL